jgi:hypothetical protein
MANINWLIALTSGLNPNESNIPAGLSFITVAPYLIAAEDRGTIAKLPHGAALSPAIHQSGMVRFDNPPNDLLLWALLRLSQRHEKQAG